MTGSQTRTRPGPGTSMQQDLFTVIAPLHAYLEVPEPSGTNYALTIAMDQCDGSMSYTRPQGVRNLSFHAMGRGIETWDIFSEPSICSVFSALPAGNPL